MILDYPPKTALSHHYSAPNALMPLNYHLPKFSIIYHHIQRFLIVISPNKTSLVHFDFFYHLFHLFYYHLFQKLIFADVVHKFEIF